MHTGNATLSCPLMASNYANLWSRSDLVLDAKMHFWGFGVPGLCRGTGRLQTYRASRFSTPRLPYRSRGEGVAGGIAAQAGLWRVSR